MKRLLSSLLIVLFIGTFVLAQNDTQTDQKEKQRLFYFMPSIGFGFFFPNDVNNYIEDQYDIITNEEMYVYYHSGIGGAFFFTKMLELQLAVEIAGSPKFAVIEGSDGVDYYGFRRLTPNAKFNFHIPVGKKVSILLGTGISYSKLRFKAPTQTFKDSDVGYSIQAGARINFGKMAYAPTLVFNNIKAKSGEPIEQFDEFGFPMGYYSGGGLDLSYIGVQISNVLYF